jgi:hypothetical protein
VAKPSSEIALADKMQLKDVLRLMEGARKHGIAHLIMPGLEISLAPAYAQTSVAAAPQAAAVANPRPTSAQAFDAVQQARVEAAAQHRAKLERLRRESSGSIGLGTEKLVEGVFKAALETKPAVA